MKELKPSPQLDGTLEENKRAIQRIIDSLTEEEIAEAMSDKYAYLDEERVCDYFCKLIFLW